MSGTCTAGGGLSGGDELTAKVTNTIFRQNRGPSGFYDQISSLGYMIVRHSNIQGGIPGIHTGPLSTIEWQSGNLDADPLFVLPEGKDGVFGQWADNDYHLAAGSPCIDTGDNSLVRDDIELDLDGLPRLSNCRVDMGVYELPNPLAAPTPELIDSEVSIKNRYLSFTPPPSPSEQLAIRVTLTASEDFPNDVGRQWWVGEPTEVGEAAAIADPAPGLPSFLAATLQCEPHFTNWDAIGEIHVYHRGIVPRAGYMIEAIRSGCNLAREDNYSDPLLLPTAAWGDTVGTCSLVRCTVPGNPLPPDGTGDVTITDALTVIAKFSNSPGAIMKAMADLEPETLDHVINITDALFVLNAFSGLGYRDAPFVTDLGEVCEPPVECVSELLADSNGDGVIDSSDNDDEDFTAMVFTYNVDDDDFSGTPDFDDVASVVGEDDLAELKLSAPECDPADPAAASWSLSWPLSTVKVWLTPDKSDITTGGPLVSGLEYPWPLPTSVWLEASEAIENMQVTLWVNSFVGSAVLPDTVLVTAECPAVTLAAALGECYANIQTDSNNDLRIDVCDESVENDSPGVIVYINDDDDNDNGTLDMDESPVIGENDLQEVRLSTTCLPVDPNLAWWSLSWTDLALPAMQIWFESDKSDGSANGTTPLLNAAVDPIPAQYPWPAPPTVWIESRFGWGPKDLTFTVFDGNGVSVARSSGAGQSNVVTVSAQPAVDVRLRIAMFVEPGADPENPPDITAGCKLTLTQVRENVRDMMGLARNAHKGLRLVWGEIPQFEPVDLVEHSCLKCLCSPVSPPSESVCSLFGNPPNDDMRGINSDWFVNNVVGRSPADPTIIGGLIADDEYLSDSCAINIYFAGNILNPFNSAVWGTVRGIPQGRPFIVVNDRGVFDHDIPIANMTLRADSIRARKTLSHEAVCHLLTGGMGHTSVASGACSNDLCISGGDFSNRAAVCYGGGPVILSGAPPPNQFDAGLRNAPPVRGSGVSVAHSSAIVAYLQAQNCVP